MSELRQSSAIAMFDLPKQDIPGTAIKSATLANERSADGSFSQELSTIREQSERNSSDVVRQPNLTGRKPADANTRELNVNKKSLTPQNTQESTRIKVDGQGAAGEAAVVPGQTPGRSPGRTLGQALFHGRDVPNTYFNSEKFDSQDQRLDTPGLITVNAAVDRVGEAQVEFSDLQAGVAQIANRLTNGVDATEMADGENGPASTTASVNYGSEETDLPEIVNTQSRAELLAADDAQLTASAVTLPSNSEPLLVGRSNPTITSAKATFTQITQSVDPAESEVVLPASLAMRLQYVEKRVLAETKGGGDLKPLTIDESATEPSLPRPIDHKTAADMKERLKLTLEQSKSSTTASVNGLLVNRMAPDNAVVASSEESQATEELKNDVLQQSLLGMENKRRKKQDDVSKAAVNGDESLFQKVAVTRKPISTNLLTVSDMPNVTSSQLMDNMFAGPAGGIVTAPPQIRSLSENPVMMNAPANVAILSDESSDAMASNIRWMSAQGVKNAVVNVTPSGMGPITVQIGIESEQMNVSIIAVQGSTREALDAMLPRLREQLATLGHESVKVDVSDGRSDNSRAGHGEQFREDHTQSFAGKDDNGKQTGNDARDRTSEKDLGQWNSEQTLGDNGIRAHQSSGYDIYV